MKNKKNLIKTIITTIIAFLIIDAVIALVPSLLTRIIYHSKYSVHLIAESIAALTCLIIIIVTKKSYVFTQKKEKFFKSLFVGLPMLIISIVYFLVNGYKVIGNGLNIYNLITLILYCTSIGLFEEFLCRGWLENRLLERYGSNRKQVITSIIISALIFGLMHITNIWNTTQGVIVTILQIINAISLGIFLGAVYYRTKNIWSVAFLHGFYDFAILVSEVNSLKECTTGVITKGVLLTNLISILALSLLYIASSAIILRRSKINHLLKEQEIINKEDEKREEKRTILLIFLAISVFFIPAPKYDEKEMKDYTICYDYAEQELKEYEISIPNYQEFKIINRKKIESDSENKLIKYENFEFTFFIENNKAIIKNNIKSKTITLDYDNVININLITNKDKYLLMIYTDDNLDSKIYLTEIDLNDISNEEEYLKTIESSFKEFVTPDISSIGYLTIPNNTYKYPVITTKMGDIMMIDENQNLYVIK